MALYAINLEASLATNPQAKLATFIANSEANAKMLLESGSMLRVVIERGSRAYFQAGYLVLPVASPSEGSMTSVAIVLPCLQDMLRKVAGKRGSSVKRSITEHLEMNKASGPWQKLHQAWSA